MPTIHGRARITPDGTLTIPLPALAGKEVDFTLDVHAPETNGAHPPTAPAPSRPMTQADWEKLIDETAGSMPDFPSVTSPPAAYAMTREEWVRFVDSLAAIDDPTFVRPPQGDFERREPMD